MQFPFLKKERTIPRVFETTETVTAIDIIAPSSIEVGQNFIKLGEKLGRTYFVFSYPRYLTTGWFSPIVNLDIPMDISFFIFPVEGELVLKQLRKKVTEVEAEISEREDKGFIRDPVLETASQDIDEHLSQQN